MEAATVHTPLQLQAANHAVTGMDISMDIDMDLDLGPELIPGPIELEAAATTVNNGLSEELNSTIANEDPQFEKVHIRGVDDLSTDDIKRFAAEHFKGEELARVEWIDDTSANIIYNSAEAGLQALTAFTQQSVEEGDSALPSLRLRSAKALSTHPDSVLQVRSAVKTDRKKKRAHEASRFYLMHPEHDPRERMRREFAERRRSGRRDDSTGDYNRRRFDDREHRRRRGLASNDRFDETMYDDSEEPSRGSSGDRTRGRRKTIDDLFPDRSERSSGRLRDRSASPVCAEFEDITGLGDDRRASSRRFRDRSPQHSRDRNGYSRLNAGKELFASANASSDESSGRRELFPNKTASSYLKKELFPKSTMSNHRRSDAFDAADETADLFAKRITVPLVDGAGDVDHEMNAEGQGRRGVELFPGHISGPTKSFKIRGKSDNPGFSIRGNADNLDNGISIRGAASVRELFPSKYTGNEGKELFSDKLEGRGGRRRKAEDMFS
ncbi:hypothetical protein LOZ61_000743 [Ophidiomyces ophidiicola]|uniref:Uncharacterized protein n=1 Tax=Ophidiomyces ophidiicola TaxID=1387563 RepID=A0ACB8UM91_9EURO|nr:uncharacterized protein LOZ57_001060 [Ophidiomyces ophidiicola]KAI1916841.1 hypothetical protein LOZ61_000743 [Ophidiomyces ophidiicola]KAI1917002.1 hypothetical protein LOZ64_003153 [Ophidiomyces ophidiicola]KAI1926717.1 hypothetical protein LOZ60_003420 [Ophidiomyces ophidiicola]KAI1948698.1 hypothetical protein LOZ59_006292 [Ophidiomyces ophidiicola]KAI1951649.1 hypothetical protein LOZ57_001060 [Ophidiomyces ophidiicola]